MESWIDLLISAIPGLEGLIDQAEILISAIPGGWGLAASTFLILAVGGIYLLRHFGYVKELFGGNWEE